MPPPMPQPIDYADLWDKAQLVFSCTEDNIASYTAHENHTSPHFTGCDVMLDHWLYNCVESAAEKIPENGCLPNWLSDGTTCEIGCNIDECGRDTFPGQQSDCNQPPSPPFQPVVDTSQTQEISMDIPNNGRRLTLAQQEAVRRHGRLTGMHAQQWEAVKRARTGGLLPMLALDDQGAAHKPLFGSSLPRTRPYRAPLPIPQPVGADRRLSAPARPGMNEEVGRVNARAGEAQNGTSSHINSPLFASVEDCAGRFVTKGLHHAGAPAVGFMQSAVPAKSAQGQGWWTDNNTLNGQSVLRTSSITASSHTFVVVVGMASDVIRHAQRLQGNSGVPALLINRPGILSDGTIIVSDGVGTAYASLVRARTTAIASPASMLEMGDVIQV